MNRTNEKMQAHMDAGFERTARSMDILKKASKDVARELKDAKVELRVKSIGRPGLVRAVSDAASTIDNPSKLLHLSMWCMCRQAAVSLCLVQDM